MVGKIKFARLLSAFGLLASCASNDGDRADTPERFDAISADETLTLTGTEPFWNMVIEGDALTYSTPENAPGEAIIVTRFAGNNGLGFSGELQGQVLQIAVTPGICNDGMSDQEYPFTTTISLGDATLHGCGFSDSSPTTGDESE